MIDDPVEDIAEAALDGSPLLCLDETEQHRPHTWHGHGGVAYRCSGEAVDPERPWGRRTWPPQGEDVLEIFPSASPAVQTVHYRGRTS